MSTNPEDGSAEALRHLLTKFQSLGDNCEFGLVQRFVGVEPSGLFRFVIVPIHALIEALDSNFRHYGDSDDLEIFVGALNYLSCRSRRYGFAYSTGKLDGEADPRTQLQHEIEKVAYLKQRLLGDLASGKQILVRKGRPDESIDDIMALARAIQRHGPSTLLRVREAEDGEEPGSVRWVSERVMEGTVQRFSPLSKGIVNVDLEPWIVLCRNAYRLAQGLPGQPFPLRIESALVRFANRAEPHLTPEAADASGPDRARPDLTTRTVGIRAGPIAPDSIAVFSAWVWIPESFEGQRLSAVLARHGLVWHDADLAIRETWQRVWVSARVPPKHGRLRAGFGTVGPAGQRFWSTGWRLNQGPIPADEEPPVIAIPDADRRLGGRIGEGLGRWLSGLTR